MPFAILLARGWSPLIGWVLHFVGVVVAYDEVGSKEALASCAVDGPDCDPCEEGVSEGLPK